MEKINREVIRIARDLLFHCIRVQMVILVSALSLSLSLSHT